MRVLWIAAIAALLTSCAYQPDKKPQEAYQAMQQDTPVQGSNKKSTTLPTDVAAFLNQSAESNVSGASELVGEEPRFVLQADGVAAKQFFYSLTVDTPYNIVVHPDVTGDISLDLKDVTIDETLDVVSDIYGYEIRRDGRMIQVYPAGVRTQTFTLDYLSLKRLGLSQTQITSGGVSQ
ncbi:secretin and TonB N-terminal domain-containing protein, partial [Idiomarina sp.]|uniref:secretin and TonB N-terminal domain-containing protein n=1 Tax=Idiomarina sp. TaxID=1874361 RepID=UPI003516C8E2